jgi:putative glutathione S-transferase
MGKLIDGVWSNQRHDTKKPDGKFVRPNSIYRNNITPDSNASYPAETGRYHLYVSQACPWAHRTLIFRQLKGLTAHITTSVVHPDMFDDGWTFETDDAGASGDTLYGFNFLREVYLKDNDQTSTRVTVPILWDKKTRTIVSNESSEIIRMFNSAFDDLTGNSADFWPADLHNEIEALNARIYSNVNNGVYKSGFATSQSAYDTAVHALFETLDWLEARLAENRYLTGDRLTEADWRLFTTLARFDYVYHQHFKCSRRRLIDYPNLWAYTRELYQIDGVAQTTNFNHIIRHYHHSHESINPHRIIPITPVIDWFEPHGRG